MSVILIRKHTEFDFSSCNVFRYWALVGFQLGYLRYWGPIHMILLWGLIYNTLLVVYGMVLYHPTTSHYTETERSSFWQKISSLAALEIVILTNSSAVNDENFIKMIFDAMWRY